MSAGLTEAGRRHILGGLAPVNDDPTCFNLYQACACAPEDKTPALVLADAIMEHGFSRFAALRAACRPHYYHRRAAPLTKASSLVADRGRRGVALCSLIRDRAGCFSGAVAIDVVYGWGSPRMVGRHGGRMESYISPQTGWYIRPYRRSTLRIHVGCWWVIRAARDAMESEGVAREALRRFFLNPSI